MMAPHKFKHTRGADAAQPGGRHSALWVSTSLETRGGIATFVRNMQPTLLWRDWNIRHVATHCNGSVARRLLKFIVGLGHFTYELLVRRPDVVHIHTSSNGSFARKWLLTWLAVLFRVPVILHVHGSGFHEFFDLAPGLVKRMIRATLERASVVIALGDTWASRLRRIAPDAEIEVVPNAIRLARPVEHSISGAVRVAFVGEVCTRKGAFLLIEAWAQLVRSRSVSCAELIIAGDGEVGQARKLVERLSVGATVKVLGWVSTKEIDGLLSNTQVLVLPSLNEGQPMAILEAMARGICVVSSSSGGIPEMLADESGVLVDPLNPESLAEALQSVITNEATRRDIGANARRRVQDHFDVDRISAVFDDLYRRVIAN